MYSADFEDIPLQTQSVTVDPLKPTFTSLAPSPPRLIELCKRFSLNYFHKLLAICPLPYS
jgi:hypothetical protein